MPEPKSRIRGAGFLLLMVTIGAISACSSDPPQSDRMESASLERDAPNRRGRAIRFADFVNIDTRDIPVMMALDALEAQGYAVTRTYHSNATLIADLLMREEVDIGLLNNHTMWSAILKGADVRTIAEFTAPTTVVAARKEIRTCRPGLHALLSYAEQFPQIQMDGLHVRRDWAAANAVVVKDFLRALLRAQRRILADPTVLYDESVRRLSLDAATAKAVGDFHLNLHIWDPDGGLTPGNVQYTIDFLKEIGSLPAGLKAADVADFSYLDAVVREEQ